MPFGAISMVGARRCGAAISWELLMASAGPAVSTAACSCSCKASPARLETIHAFGPAVSCSIEEARQARAAGADCVLVKWELVQLYAPDRLGVLVEALQDATCGDD